MSFSGHIEYIIVQKKKRIFVQISPLCERGLDFDPSVIVQVTEEHWVNSHGETTQPPTHMISADRDEVSQWTMLNLII